MARAPHPGLLFFGWLGLGLSAHALAPRWLPERAARPAMVLGAAILAMAALLLFWAVGALRRAQTPLEPGALPQRLLTEGPYRLSRNPIYLALALTILGLGLLMGSPWLLAAVPLLLATEDLLVVRREERRLREVFGAEFAAWARRTRRWL